VPVDHQAGQVLCPQCLTTIKNNLAHYWTTTTTSAAPAAEPDTAPAE